MSIDAPFRRLCPTELFTDKNGPCEIKYNSNNGFGTGANQLVISAVPGKKIRILSLYGNSSFAGANAIVLRSGSGGASVISKKITTAAGGKIDLPYQEVGHGETAAGVGLYADVDQNYMYFDIAYIEVSI